MIPEGGRTSYRGDVLAIVVADTRQIARAAVELVTVEYDVLEPMVDPIRVVNSDDPAVWELDGNTLSTSTYSRGDVDAALASAAASRCPRRSRPSASNTPSSSPNRRLPCRPWRRTLDDRSLYVYSGGQGIWDDRNDIAAMLGTRHQPHHDRTRLERGRVRRERGHVEPGAHRPGRLAPRCAGEDHVVARRVAADAPEAPPDPDGLRSGLRRRRQAHGRQGAHDRRLGSVRIGRHEGARTGGGPRHRPVSSSATSTSRRSPCRTNNSVCGAFRGFGANQAQFAMEGVLERLAEQVGISGLGDPQSQRRVARRSVGSRPESWTTDAREHGCVSTPSSPPTTQADAAGKAVGWVSGSRTPGSATASRRSPRRSSTFVTMARSRSATAGPRWARACTPCANRWRSRNSTSPPNGSRSSSTRLANSAPGRPREVAAR